MPRCEAPRPEPPEVAIAAAVEVPAAADAGIERPSDQQRGVSAVAVPTAVAVPSAVAVSSAAAVPSAVGVPSAAAVPSAGPGRERVRGTLWGAGVLVVSALVGLVLAAALWGAAGSDGPASPAFTASGPAGRFDLGAVLTQATVPRGASITARVHAHSVRVYSRPDNHSVAHQLRTLYASGRPLPLMLLVDRRRPGWLKVSLPVRPNLSTGWIHSAHVSLHIDPYHVTVALAAHQLTVWRETHMIEREPIGVGVSLSPTPSGRYYITDLLRPPNPHGLYGPYAFGLSAYSPVYTTFAGGDGQIGLHGTDDPAGIGHDVSHGCVRLNNRSITRLAHLLPIGTPVLIRR